MSKDAIDLTFERLAAAEGALSTAAISAASAGAAEIASELRVELTNVRALTNRLIDFENKRGTHR